MDIEFTVQDIFALTRPQWKFASSLEEATKAFQLAVAQDQKTAGLDKAMEADDMTSGPSSDDENIDGDADEVEEPFDESASEEEDVEVCYMLPHAKIPGTTLTINSYDRMPRMILPTTAISTMRRSW